MENGRCIFLDKTIVFYICHFTFNIVAYRTFLDLLKVTRALSFRAGRENGIVKIRSFILYLLLFYFSQS